MGEVNFCLKLHNLGKIHTSNDLYQFYKTVYIQKMWFFEILTMNVINKALGIIFTYSFLIGKDINLGRVMWKPFYRSYKIDKLFSSEKLT